MIAKTLWTWLLALLLLGGVTMLSACEAEVRTDDDNGEFEADVDVGDTD